MIYEETDGSTHIKNYRKDDNTPISTGSDSLRQKPEIFGAIIIGKYGDALKLEEIAKAHNWTLRYQSIAEKDEVLWIEKRVKRRDE